MKINALTLVFSVASLLVLPLKASALTFNFTLDNTFDETLEEPFVGTGRFSFNGDPGDGTFGLNSLDNFDFNFNFTNGFSFINAEIITPIEEILIVISTTGQQRRVQFSNVNPFGSTILIGSLDFINFENQSFLSFEPPGIEGNLNLYSSNNILGTYIGVAVPEFDFTNSLLTFGALNMGLSLLRNQKSKVSKY